MNKLIVCIMGQNCERFIKMCLESVKDADGIIYCDGGSTDGTLKYLLEDGMFASAEYKKESIPPHLERWIIQNKYDQEDIGMNGKQRNFYLNYLKESYPDDWCLCLDADEVVEDLSRIKEFIQTAQDGLYSVKMRHLIQDLAHEDSTVNEHFVLNRLFKISEADSYPEVEHPVLQGKKGEASWFVSPTTIWHLAYIPNLWEIKKRYDNHMKKSNIHTPQFLSDWYKAHLFGTYPKKEFNPVELPDIIFKEFGINKDEFYFANRGIDLKHPAMVHQWYEYFKPDNVLDLGCGRGPYLYFWRWFVKDTQGIELSQWAINNAFCPSSIIQGDITNEGCFRRNLDNPNWDLITAVDVLEHLNDNQLNKALFNISNYGKRFLFSIPFIGDPNLKNDNTHKQFKTKEDWIKLIESHGIKIKETPSNWLFAPQILIGEK